MGRVGLSRQRALVPGLVTLAAVAVGIGLWMFQGRGGGERVSEVAFFLDSAADDTWRDVVRCLREFAPADGVVTLSPDVHVVRWPSAPGAIRFRRYEYRGVAGIVEQVREFRQKGYPLAVVSPGNSIMTAALAESLRQSTAEAPSGTALPILLITTATTVYTDPVHKKRLIELYPGRTLRFGCHNGYMARVVTNYVASLYGERETPRRVVLVKVSDDPFSQDLAEAFRREVRATFFDGLSPAEMEAALLEIELTALAPSLDVRLTAEEEELRRRMIRWLSGPGDQGALPDTLVVLAMLQAPAQRVLRALPSRSSERILLLAGDTLAPYQPAGTRIPAPWMADLPARLISFQHSFEVAEPGRSAMPPPPLLWRELVRAFMRSMEELIRSGGELEPAALRRQLLQTQWLPDEAMPRSFSFDQSGQRQGDDYGYILDVEPGHPPRLSVYPIREGGTDSPMVWEEPVVFSYPEP